jgi:hypothetical protein
MTQYNDNKKTGALAWIPIAVILLLAAVANPSLGLVAPAEAKKAQVDPEDAPIADLDIRTYGFAGKNAYVEVYGTAGGTLPEHGNEAIAYVLQVVTAGGEAQTWAVDSHEAQHGGSTDPSTMWHAHRVHLTEHPDTGEMTCLNEVDEVTHAMADGSRMIFEEFKVRTDKGVKAVVVKEITSALTVELTVLVEDPDNPPEGTECIAEVSHVFDTADLGKVRDSRPR